MKNIFITLIILFGCFSGQSQTKLKVVSSASMFTDMARNIAGKLVDIETIVPIGGDPHLHSPTPRDARIVADADLILINGLSFEGWIGELILNSGTQAKIDTITQGVQAIESEQYTGSADPHAWMTAANGRIYIRNIKDALIKLDPINASTYDSNYQQYDQVLVDLDQKIKSTFAKIPADRRILITSHDAFSYFGDYYGLQLEPIVGISTEAEAKTSDIQRVGKIIREKKVPAVFVESTINPKLIQQLAKDNGASIGGKLYADSLGEPDTKGGTYVGMLESNVNTVYNGLVNDVKMDAPDKSSGSSPYLMYGLLALVFLGSLIFLMKFIK